MTGQGVIVSQEERVIDLEANQKGKEAVADPVVETKTREERVVVNLEVEAGQEIIKVQDAEIEKRMIRRKGEEAEAKKEEVEVKKEEVKVENGGQKKGRVQSGSLKK